MSDGNDDISLDTLRDFEPVEWLERRIVEQDNMGDWGAWLNDFAGFLQDVLTDDGDPETLAAMMAQAYIVECEASGYPLPADFADTGDVAAARESDRQGVTAEFLAFLIAWRDAIARGRKRG